VIKRAPRSNHYTVLNTATFSLPMPAECLGVYLYLLSKPNHWSVSPVQLAKHFGCSNDRMYRIIRDLLAVSYNGEAILTRSGQAVKGSKGFATAEYTVKEPTAETAFTENADTLEPAKTLTKTESDHENRPACTGLTHTGLAHTLKTSLEITDLKKLLSIEKRSAVPVEVYRLGIDPELWLEYMATRKRVKATSTPRAIQTLINKIKKLADAGNNPIDLVEDANANGWKSVYPRNATNEPRSARELATNSNW
jgi:hypothetical protein